MHVLRVGGAENFGIQFWASLRFGGAKKFGIQFWAQFAFRRRQKFWHPILGPVCVSAASAARSGAENFGIQFWAQFLSPVSKHSQIQNKAQFLI